MRKIIWSVLSLPILIVLSQNAVAKCGAGTVIYFKFKSEIYLLLADHNRPQQHDRGWSGFGGYCDGDPFDVTAARETEEETKGFYHRDELLGKLGSSPQIRVGDFTTFFVEVDYVPAIMINKNEEQGQCEYQRYIYRRTNETISFSNPLSPACRRQKLQEFCRGISRPFTTQKCPDLSPSV
jgi:8-oxo-dGTP pyrophosphatase MutT (NUDIX family)